MFNIILFKVSEVSKILKVSKKTVYKWIDEGILSYYKIGERGIRVSQDAINNFLEKHVVEGSNLSRKKEIIN